MGTLEKSNISKRQKMKIGLVLLGVINSTSISREESSSILLSRSERANSWSRFEEMKGGNFERECIEENCDVEELAEVFDNVEVSEPIQLKYDKCSKVVTAAEMAFENLPNIDGESSKNLFRECMLAPNDFRPPTDDMRLSFEDEDFKTWLGEIIGIITNQSVELTGTAAEGKRLLKLFSKDSEKWNGTHLSTMQKIWELQFSKLFHMLLIMLWIFSATMIHDKNTHLLINITCTLRNTVI